MAEIKDGKYSSGLYHKNVWMPPLHTEHKVSMLCQTKGVSICPHTFGCPLYLNNTKKTCFVQLKGCPYAPIHLYAPCMFRCCHMFGCTPYMFGCLHMFGHPIYLDAHLYIWTPPYVCTLPICLMLPVCLGAPCVWTPLCMVRCLHMFGHPPMCFGCPSYV